MKMKMLTGAVSLVFSTLVLVLTGNSKTETALQTVKQANASQLGNKVRHLDPTGTLNGSINPELIPDKVAYSMLFRFLANRPPGAEENSVRAYLQQRLGEGCDESESAARSVNDVIDVLLATSREFNERVKPLDSQAKKIKDRHWPRPNSEVIRQLNHLQGNKEALVAEMAASIQTRLNAEGRIRLKRLIREGFKRKIKIAPGPQSAPGGPGWRELASQLEQRQR